MHQQMVSLGLVRTTDKKYPGLLLSADGPPEMDLFIHHEMPATSKAYDDYAPDDEFSYHKMINRLGKTPSHFQEMLASVLGLFTRLVHGPSFNNEQHIITNTVGESPRLAVSKAVNTTIQTSTGLLSSQRLLHGYFGVLRAVVQFAGSPFVWQDLFPSYTFAQIQSALNENKIRTIRRMFLEATESLGLFCHRTDENYTFSTYNNCHNKMKFVAVRSKGISTFLPNAARMNSLSPDRSPDGYRTGATEQQRTHVRVKYNYLPLWTTDSLGFRGWWESGVEKVFRSGLQPEYLQFLKDQREASK